MGKWLLCDWLCVSGILSLSKKHHDQTATWREKGLLHLYSLEPGIQGVRERTQGRKQEAGHDAETWKLLLTGFLSMGHSAHFLITLRITRPGDVTAHRCSNPTPHQSLIKENTPQTCPRVFSQPSFPFPKWLWLVSHWHKISQNLRMLQYVSQHSNTTPLDI